MPRMTSQLRSKLQGTHLPGVPLRGVATLTLVMVLFFVMAMVAAYANRNLIFEQRISINNLRTTSAAAAAEGGLDWAIAMLNGGRSNASCVADPASASTFRSRYLQVQGDGSYVHTTWADTLGELRPVFTACVMTAAPWTCHCPAAGRPDFVALAEAAPVFRVTVESALLPGGLPRPGAIVVKSQGCSNFISISADPNYDTSDYASCHKARGSQRARVDGLANMQVTLGLVKALPAPPAAALTAGATISMTAGNRLTVSNPSAQAGVTIHAGNALPASTEVLLLGPQAGAIDTGRTGDAKLLSLVAPAVGEPGMFESMFGMDQATYSRQPAAVLVDCAVGCTGASVVTPMANNPGRILWIAGDLNLDQAAVLGSAAQPVMLVVSGDLALSAAVTVNGFVFARDINWNATAAGSRINGAAVAARNFTGQSAAVVAYDANILRIINLGYGSFVRVPGSWRYLE